MHVVKTSSYRWLVGLDGLFRQSAKVKVEHVRVALVGRGLVDDRVAEVVRLAVGSRDLDECVDVANAWYVVGYEGSQLEVELDILRLVALDVLEYVLDVATDRQVSKSGRIITT